MNEEHRERLIFSEPDYDFEKSRVHRCIGQFSPMATTVLRPLFEVAFMHGLIVKRREKHSNRLVQQDRHSFYIVLDGELKAQIRDEVYSIRVGEIAYVPYGSLARVHNEEEVWYLHLTFDSHPYWDQMMSLGYYQRTYESTEMLFMLMDRISSAFENPTSQSLNFAERDGRYLLDIMQREKMLSCYRPSALQEKLQELFDQINEASQKNWCLSSMARSVNLTEGELIHDFREVYGISPIDMVIRCRLAMARKLIEEEATDLVDISRRVGFENMDSFNRTFEKHFGVFPDRAQKRVRPDRVDFIDDSEVQEILKTIEA